MSLFCYEIEPSNMLFIEKPLFLSMQYELTIIWRDHLSYLVIHIRSDGYILLLHSTWLWINYNAPKDRQRPVTWASAFRAHPSCTAMHTIIIKIIMYSISIALIHGIHHALSALQYIFLLVHNTQITQRTRQLPVGRFYNICRRGQLLFFTRGTS